MGGTHGQPWRVLRQMRWRGGCQGVASCRQGLVGEERGGRMVGWGCQQRKEEEIRLEFWFRIRCLYRTC